MLTSPSSSKIASSSSNPISSLKNWHTAANKATEPVDPTPSFEQAVETFESDANRIKGYDLDYSSPQSFNLGVGALSPRDKDLRPGEIDVPGVGSLHSTPEGFSLRLIADKGQRWQMLAGFGKRAFRSREYKVDEKSNSIAVTNIVGESYSHSIGGLRVPAVSKTEPGYRETYTINLGDNTVSQYKRNGNPFGISVGGITEGGALASGKRLLGNRVGGVPKSFDNALSGGLIARS